MSLLDVIDRLAGDIPLYVTYDPERCLNAKPKFSDCEICCEICPVDAIRPGKPPGFDETNCTNCLACLPACPIGAYYSNDPVPALLKCAVRIGLPAVELVCQMNPQPTRGPSAKSAAIRVHGCLAGLGSATYLCLAVLGTTVITLRIEFCDACPMSSLKSQIIKQATTIRTMSNPQANFTIAFHDNPDNKSLISERPFWDADNPPISRRDLFRFKNSSDQLTMANRLVNNIDFQGQRPGRERQRENAAVNQLQADGFIDQTQLLGDFNYALVTINSDCNACGICARVCPTSALRFQRRETHYQVDFSAQDCIGCEICLKNCPTEAINIVQNPSIADVFGGDRYRTLIEGALTKCGHCGVWFAADSDDCYCSVCTYRLKHPFGSIEPPGYQSDD